jgi:hypothetical protein
MKTDLTVMSELATIPLVGQTQTGSAEVQFARDSQLKATNCRWGGSPQDGLRHLTSATPFYDLQRLFRVLLCLKKPPCRKQGKSLNCEVDLSNSR